MDVLLDLTRDADGRVCEGNEAARVRTLDVPRRPEPHNPSAPRRIAHRMVLGGTWVEVDGALGKEAFHRAIVDGR